MSGDHPDLLDPNDGHEHCDHATVCLTSNPPITLLRCCWCGRPLKRVTELGKHGPLAQP